MGRTSHIFCSINCPMSSSESESDEIGDEDDPQYKFMSKATAINIETVDKKALWEVLGRTQCPLMPDRYDKSGKIAAAYYFNNDFFMKDDSDSDTDCRVVRFGKKTAKQNRQEKRKCKDDAELMMAVDQYLSKVSINRSQDIYSKLKTALAETKGVDDGDTSNDAYQQLIPTMLGM